MYLCEIQGSKPQKQTLHSIKANSSEIIQFFFSPGKNIQTCTQPLLPCDYSFFSIYLFKLRFWGSWGKRAGKWGLRVLIPLLSKMSTDEANFLLIKNITHPHSSPRSTRHAHRIKVFCCLMIFCIALKVFVQGDVCSWENTHFWIHNKFMYKKRCWVSQRNGPLTWPLREYKYYFVLQME